MQRGFIFSDSAVLCMATTFRHGAGADWLSRIREPADKHAAEQLLKRNDPESLNKFNAMVSRDMAFELVKRLEDSMTDGHKSAGAMYALADWKDPHLSFPLAWKDQIGALSKLKPDTLEKLEGVLGPFFKPSQDISTWLRCGVLESLDTMAQTFGDNPGMYSDAIKQIRDIAPAVKTSDVYKTVTMLSELYENVKQQHG